jgi:hypothetical protein
MSIVSSGAINLGGNTVTVPGRVTSSAEFELYENGKGYSSTGTSTISLSDSAVRTLAGVASGAISFSDLYGKSALTPGSQVFTANGTYTVPFGYNSITIEVWGAGGGGGGALLTTVTPGSSGGNSQVSGTGLTIMTALGGGAGNTTPATGGTASGGTVTNTTGSSSSSTAGANGVTGSVTGGTGGSGGDGGPSGSGETPTDGIAPGAGGGGTIWDSTGMPMCGCCGYYSYAYGGAAGGYSKTTTTTLTAGTVLTITVGTGGAGGSSLGTSGASGGNGQVIITYS